MVEDEFAAAFDAAFAELGFGDNEEGDGDTAPEPTADETADEVEVPDEDTEADDEPAGDDEQDDEQDDEDEEATAPEVIEVTEDAVIRLPDGTEVPVKESALRQADYTRKTQQLARERDEFAAEKEAWGGERAEFEQQLDTVLAWYEDRSANPAWAAVEEAVRDTDDPTLVVAKVLKALNDQGQLDPRFAEAFGLDQPDPEVLERARKAGEGDRVAELERKLQEQEEARQAEQRQQAVIAELNRQWAQIVTTDSLTYDTPEAEFEAKKDLVLFAREHGITDLTIAHAARVGLQGATRQAAKPDPKTVARKRQSRAITRKAASPAPTASVKRPGSTRAAALATVEEFLAGE
jgi:hypothetical protein